MFRIFLAFFLIISTSAFAEVSLSVKSGEIAKTKILFVGFDPVSLENPHAQRDSFEIFERIRRNLRTTDLFEIIKQSDPEGNILSQALAVETVPDFAKYSRVNIGAIVIAQFTYDLTGNLEMRVRVWDVLDQRQIFGKLYVASRDNYRRISNIISDEIFKAATTESAGHFDSKIVYVSESGPVRKRVKRLAMINFDGEGHHFLTDGKDLVLTPVFSRGFSKGDGEIFYVSYARDKPQVFSLNSRTLRSRKIGGFRGTTFSAATHPTDLNIILLTVINDGNSDIYEFNTVDNSARRLTRSSAIDTTPSYSPSGSKIIFASDREGGQKLYVMNYDASSVKRVSFGKGSYSKPVWSPDGNLIAFTKSKGGKFYIGVMTPDGSSERLLTSGYMVEGARWSPNGRYLVFSRKDSPYGRKSIPRIYVIDVLTGFEVEVPTPKGEGGTDPDWL